jgi:biopolymer transport protein ExbB/TolQ
MNIFYSFLYGLALGLIVAIPYWVFNYYLCKRIDRMTESLENNLQKFMEK